jgi:hypothetical protein
MFYFAYLLNLLVRPSPLRRFGIFDIFPGFELCVAPTPYAPSSQKEKPR